MVREELKGDGTWRFKDGDLISPVEESRGLTFLSSTINYVTVKSMWSLQGTFGRIWREGCKWQNRIGWWDLLTNESQLSIFRLVHTLDTLYVVLSFTHYSHRISGGLRGTLCVFGDTGTGSDGRCQRKMSYSTPTKEELKTGRVPVVCETKTFLRLRIRHWVKVQSQLQRESFFFYYFCSHLLVFSYILLFIINTIWF